MKTALILFGVLHRSLGLTINEFRSVLLKSLQEDGEIDIFYHSWDTTSILNPRAGEDNVAIDPADIGRYLPEANGVIDSVDEFDRSINWEPLFFRNPMRHCTTTEAAAKVTLMNFRRTIESQARAWEYFERTKTKRYDRVVATRADLRFIRFREPSDQLRKALAEGATNRDSGFGLTVWTPRINPWGGINDKFVLGSEEAVKVWCGRLACCDDWVRNGGPCNSEWLLMNWLQRNGVGVGLLDVVFQRVRANGKIAAFDQEFSRAPRAERPVPTAFTSAQPTPKRNEVSRERFLVLTRKMNEPAKDMAKMLAPLGKTEIIVDCPSSEGIWHPDEVMRGYVGIMANPKTITAWSRALYHVSQTFRSDEAVWFVEDDVAANPAMLRQLIEKTRAADPAIASAMIAPQTADPRYAHWSRGEPYFKRQWKALMPIGRMHPDLIELALNFQRKHGHLTFHEILFPTLAMEASMNYLDWLEHEDFNELMPVFTFRPLLEGTLFGVCHPVKDYKIHRSICSHVFHYPGLSQSHGPDKGVAEVSPISYCA